MDQVTPRVNSVLLEKYRGKVVRIVGKIIQHSGNYGVIEASDNGHVRVQLNNENTWGTPYVEIIGRVNDDLSITEFTSSNFGENFDLKLHNQLVQASQRYVELFE
ncbi:uncharacterized protein VTP21DRAFT_2815 [Calcarisporiella thermophila]|uniref:uncharacterized protein n=1 Tax=Calcarisporiella thermophila TaxID=911321 RepID=UPI003743D64E